MPHSEKDLEKVLSTRHVSWRCTRGSALSLAKST